VLPFNPESDKGGLLKLPRASLLITRLCGNTKTHEAQNLVCRQLLVYAWQGCEACPFLTVVGFLPKPITAFMF
jgi:hypothetical protein